MKPVAVLLSGSGVYDGSEIYETVSVLLTLSQLNQPYQCVAPDMLQHQVINHLTGEEMPEKRSVLIEAARLARGDVKSLNDVNPDDFSALIVPGGFGAAKNFSDFAFKGKDLTVESSVLAFCQAFAKVNKPACYICIAPALVAKIYGPGVKVTIGHDADTAKAIQATGGVHEVCEVDQFVVDTAHKVVTTPAFMLAKNIAQAYEGISRAVKETLSLR